MYNKLPPAAELSTADAENLADVLYEVGKDLTAKKDYQMGAKWLQRARDTLSNQSLEALSREAVELRLAIIQYLVTAFLGFDTEEGRSKATELVHYISSELGDTTVVNLLTLELLDHSPTEAVDVDNYGFILRRLINGFRSSESYFRLVIRHTRKLHKLNPQLGCRTLDELLRVMCLQEYGWGSDYGDWVETAVVHRIWMAHESDDAEAVQGAQQAFSQLVFPLGQDSAVAALAVSYLVAFIR